MPTSWYVFTTLLLADLQTDTDKSYLCGSLNVFAWIAITAGVTVIVPQILFAVLVHFDTSYIPKPWHVFLIYQAVNAVCLIHNIFALRKSMWVFNYFREYPAREQHWHPSIIDQILQSLSR